MFYSLNSENNAHMRAAILDYVLYQFICVLFWPLRQVRTKKNAQDDRPKPTKVQSTVMEDKKKAEYSSLMWESGTSKDLYHAWKRL